MWYLLHSIMMINMNKVALLLPAAILVAGCNTSPIVPGNETDTQAQQAQKISQILERGGSAFCRITNLTDNSVVEMTLAGEKMKIVGTDLSEGKKGTMINDTAYIYSWEEGQTTGFKMKLSQEEITPAPGDVETDVQENDTQERATTYDDDTKYKLDCTQRNVSDSEFAPPASVNFVDPSQMQNLSPAELQKLFPQGSQGDQE
ncbi:MAG: hypothetical protein UW23_C0021G0009 [Candidatus Collierbacteria bacterium GW2011_GWA1_44_12]|uniref:DUF4412 domain-containing protein n=2 Tax=Candidatus Collieribacteriota TaxID=1752725 RepID=A0A0G1JIF3_9BACT|nr:MAG: hypothetical protein UW23_C0021G0009 [Candidatus Collierbacteria bacterium GW2011_GWA1_44_12]